MIVFIFYTAKAEEIILDKRVKVNGESNLINVYQKSHNYILI